MKEYKGFYLKGHKDFPQMTLVVTTGRGGKIPNILSGSFTSNKEAMEAIDRYVEGKKNDKAISKG